MWCQSSCSHFRLILAVMHSVPEAESPVFLSFLSISFFSLALMWFICGWRTLDQLIIIPLQSCRQLQIRLCRSPICNWQRHSASLSILCPLTSAPAWNGKLGVCWAAIRSVDWLLQCSALPRLLYCRLVSWMKPRLICRYCNQSDQLMATFQSHSRGLCRD